MELSRRRAITAAVGGLVAGAGLWSLREQRVRGASDGGDGGTAPDRTALTAVAEVVFPTEIDSETTATLVRSYLGSQPSERRARIRATVEALDRQARQEYGMEFARLGAGTRETLLRELGVDRVTPDPDGTVAERVRYYLVNGALYALFTDPGGGRLVGIENPLGHPGGYESYAKPPGGES